VSFDKTVFFCVHQSRSWTRRKEVGFDKDGKVLVYRLGDEVHATSAFCTHYGAPLAKGVLTGDGRVVWYVPNHFICQ
jgi:nitrite reductase/ring-hydroxylating ferredoxin subunit